MYSCLSSVSCSVVSNSVTPWTIAHQIPLSMGFSRQEYWSGLPCPSPGDLPDPGTEPGSSILQADSLLSEPPGKPSVFFYGTKNREGIEEGTAFDLDLRYLKDQ